MENRELKQQTVPRDLKRALQKVFPCLERDAYDPVFRQILFDIKGDILSLAATDGFAMAITTLKIDGLPDGQWILAYKEAGELKRILKFAKEIKWRINENLYLDISFGSRKEKITVPIQKRPALLNWRALVPANHTTEATFLAKEMKKALKELRMEDVLPIRMFIDKTSGKGSIRLLVRDVVTGNEKEVVIQAKIEGEPTKQAFFRKYLQKVADTLRGQVVLKIKGPSSPALLEKGETRWVISPAFVSW